MNRENKQLRIDNESEILIFLENYFELNRGCFSIATEQVDILQIVTDTGLSFVLCDLEFQPISKEEYLQKARNGSAHTVHAYPSGYLNIRFDYDSRKRKDSTLYLSKSFDLSIFDESLKEKINNRKGGE